MNAEQPSPERRTRPPSDGEGTSAIWIRDLQRDPGTEYAWTALSARYQARLLVEASRLLGPKLRNRVDPLEILNDAWLRIRKTIPDFEYRFRDCLYHHLRQHVAWEVQERARVMDRRRQEPVPLADIGSGELPLTPISTDDGPATVAALRDMSDRVVRGLERIPEVYPRALVAVVLEERPHQDAAKKLGLKPNTLSQQVRRGLELWRQAVGDELEAIL